MKDRWSQTLGPGGSNIAAIIHIGDTLYAGTTGNGVFSSLDDGITWHAINSGLTNFEISALTVKGSSLFAATFSGGVFRSLNGGLSWEPINSGLPQTHMSALAVLNDSVFLGTEDGIFVSANNGQSWSGVDTGFSHMASMVYSLTTVGSSLYAAMYFGLGTVSADGGKSWAALDGPPGNPVGYAQIGSNLFCATQKAVYRSSDNGKTWTLASNGLAGYSVASIVSIGSALYVSTYDPTSFFFPGGVFVSQNNGDSWLPLVGGLMIANAYCFDVIGKSLIVGGENGVVQIHNNPFPSLVPASAASYYWTVLPKESIAAVFGSNLTDSTVNAGSTPLPFMLAGLSVKAIDSKNAESNVPLFFVSPSQINLQIPEGLASGPASLILTKSDGSTSFGDFYVPEYNLSPGLFSANADGQGVASASILRIQQGNIQSYEPIAHWDATQNKFVTTPIDLGPPSDRVYLILYGTGMRGPDAGYIVQVGSITLSPEYVGSQGTFLGLDQINVLLPRSLAGSGEVNVQLQGYSYRTPASNTVTVRFR
jgi:uncharacterized protein (TIGR03437 family)